MATAPYSWPSRRGPRPSSNRGVLIKAVQARAYDRLSLLADGGCPWTACSTASQFDRVADCPLPGAWLSTRSDLGHRSMGLSQLGSSNVAYAVGAQVGGRCNIHGRNDPRLRPGKDVLTHPEGRMQVYVRLFHHIAGFPTALGGRRRRATIRAASAIVAGPSVSQSGKDRLCLGLSRSEAVLPIGAESLDAGPVRVGGCEQRPIEHNAAP
jgi:hypothetical protein